MNQTQPAELEFPISRDPPEGGTRRWPLKPPNLAGFPISRDPPEGGTGGALPGMTPGFIKVSNF